MSRQATKCRMPIRRKLWGCVERQRCRRSIQPGQALVELALSITFIVLLLSAAVDLGFAFKSYQELINATSEAASYLDIYPVVNCGTPTCDPIAAADTEAIRRFRTEQGPALRNIASTLDLNANGVDDFAEAGGEAYVSSMVRIDEADNTQIDVASDGSFAVGNSFQPSATDNECKKRTAVPLSTNANVTSCYIVIRSGIVYKPYILKPLLGKTMTIHAISVRRIVRGS